MKSKNKTKLEEVFENCVWKRKYTEKKPNAFIRSFKEDRAAEAAEYLRTMPEENDQYKYSVWLLPAASGQFIGIKEHKK